MASDLRTRTVSGMSWAAIAQMVTQGFTFVISMVLARLLGPRAYGLMGMIAVFTDFAAIFGGLGLDLAIVQRKNLEQRHLNTAFWINVIFGGGMTLFMAGLSPVVAWFYGEPQLTALTVTVSSRFILGALNVVQGALLNREMRFRTVALVQIGCSVASGVLGLGMAFAGCGVWSLVAQTVGGAATAAILLWGLARWRPAWSFEWEACRELFGFSAPIVGFDIVNYWARALDRLLIGKFLGAGPLGIYSRAYSLMLLPLTQITRVVGAVMVPAMSSIQDDRPRIKRAYLKTIGMIAFITFPMMVGLFVVADHFVLGLLGSRWSEAIPILKLFCWVGLVQSVMATFRCVYTSQGRTRLYLVMGSIGSLACIIAFLVGIHWGIMGVAISYSITNALMIYPFFTVPARLIGLSFVEAAKSLSSTFFCALAMGLVVKSASFLLPPQWPHWMFLTIEIPLGILSYVVMAAGIRIRPWVEARQLLLDTLAGGVKTLQSISGKSPVFKGGATIE